MPTVTTLLEPEFLRKLEQLSLVSKKIFTGQHGQHEFPIRLIRRENEQGLRMRFRNDIHAFAFDDPTKARFERRVLFIDVVAVEREARLEAECVARAEADRAEAKGLPRDSVVETYKIDPATGLAVIDPNTGLPVPETYIASRYTDDRINARRTHYEDWITMIVFNHLFSGADAYVAANLWDFKANVGATATAHSAILYASVRFRCVTRRPSASSIREWAA